MTHETGKLKVTLLSPLHLASGAADVNVDADVVHDTLGLPYFPARRLRGLLYESALEVVEMGEAAGTTQFATRAAVEALFHHDGGEVALVVDDLHLPDYEQVAADWRAILDAYAGVVRPADVLAAYTGLRMQTALDDGGRADDATLRTIRVLLPRAGDGKSLAFTGDITIQNGTAEHWQALAWACQNLRRAGGHRWRGFGSVHCELTPPPEYREPWAKAYAQASQQSSPQAQQQEAARAVAQAAKAAKQAKFLARQQQGMQGKQKSKKKRR